MDRPIRALLFTVFFLALAEIGLRAWEPKPAPVKGLPDDSTLCFVLGTSRTMRGLDPRRMEETLAASGVEKPFVANVAEKGVTTFGLYDLYRREIRPLAVDARRKVVLGIELRASGLNDSYATSEENARWERGEYRETIASVSGATSSPTMTGSDFSLERTASGLFASLALTRGRERLASIRRGFAQDGVPTWAKGAKGFDPFKEPKQPDLKASTWRRHYRETILADFRFGERQIPMLRAFCESARNDGVDVFLYVMPVTETQRGFWDPPERRKEVLDAVKAWATQERIDLLDFDTGHTIPLEQFFDTHHLSAQGASRFSRRFANEAFLPRLR